MDYSIISGHSIYLEGLKPEAQKVLDDAKKTLCLLSQDKRSALMDFVLEEREHGALYVYKEMIDAPVEENIESLKKVVVEPIEKEAFLKLPEDKIESYIGQDALKELDGNIKAQKVYSILRYLFIVGQIASIGMAVSNTGILGWFAASCLFWGAYLHSEAETLRLPKAKNRRKEAWKIFQEQQNIHN